MYKYKTGVFIGRFQPLHNAHLKTIKEALVYCEQLVILVGSCKQPRTVKNPFTFDERVHMISETIKSEISHHAIERVRFEPLVDNLYDDTEWLGQVFTAVRKYSKDEDVVVFGLDKDSSSYYLNMFTNWKRHETPLVDVIDSTEIRSMYFNSQIRWSFIKGAIPFAIREFLTKFAQTQDFSLLRREQDFVVNYKRQWEVAPYPVTFVTTDAVVVQSGHVLLVVRKSFPGAGLYALPGGFLDANKDRSVLDCCIRELQEETKINLPEKVIRYSIKGSKVFDAINRSSRGRTITHAFYIKLADNQNLPKVKGSDDAEKAVWVPISDLNPELMYEDHYSIIKSFV